MDTSLSQQVGVHGPPVQQCPCCPELPGDMPGSRVQAHGQAAPWPVGTQSSQGGTWPGLQASAGQGWGMGDLEGRLGASAGCHCPFAVPQDRGNRVQWSVTVLCLSPKLVISQWLIAILRHTLLLHSCLPAGVSPLEAAPHFQDKESGAPAISERVQSPTMLI